MPPRADARRNRDLLLATAREAFAEQGIEASLRDVARRAGVGIGTLYRHFPTREALLEALLRDGFDRLRGTAEELLTSASPGEALQVWMRELARRSTTYRGLPESVMAALHDEESELHVSCEAMRAAGGRLLARAQEAGAVRADLTTVELLSLTAGIAWVSEQSPDGPGVADRLLSLVTTGLT
ncbi:TetR/AcrR family transcriptional regulator [Streptosporangium sp. KLBMP 9127]|nr:TetR/AcrR family transcriptional regulator [Streptosporangium sp. KLBMP 9127]